MTIRTWRRPLATLVPVALLGAVAFATLGPTAPDLVPTAHADEIVHLRLNSTQPEADAAVAESPTEIRLFYSEPPQMHGTSVRLADSEGELVATTEATADAEDPREVFIVPDEPLAPGTYTVHWRTIAQDGHAQRGDFSFRVTGAH